MRDVRYSHRPSVLKSENAANPQSNDYEGKLESPMMMRSAIYVRDRFVDILVKTASRMCQWMGEINIRRDFKCIYSSPESRFWR